MLSKHVGNSNIADNAIFLGEFLQEKNSCCCQLRICPGGIPKGSWSGVVYVLHYFFLSSCSLLHWECTSEHYSCVKLITETTTTSINASLKKNLKFGVMLRSRSR